MLEHAHSASSGRFLRLAGDHRQLGFLYGRAYRDEVRAFLEDGLARVNLLRHAPLDPQKLDDCLQMYWTDVCDHLPELAEQLLGLAEGADISRAHACLLQFRRELIGYRKVPTLGDCSTIAARGPRPYLAQTIDLNGGMSPLATVLRIDGAANAAPDILMFTFKGLLGYLGMNSAGLCVGINVVLAGPWGRGVSPYLTVRRMLSLHSVDACLALLATLPHASSRAFTLLDANRLVVVELGSGKLKVQERSLSTHTNHFLDQELARRDEINVLSGNASRKRLALLDQFAARCSHDEQIAHMFTLLSSHDLYPLGLCAHNEGNLRREETVGAVMMLPTEGRMLVRFGQPCEARTEEFCF